MSTFSEQLITARKAAGLTQEQLADAVHVARNTISSWERGRTQPNLETLYLLGQVLHYDFMNGGAVPQADPENPAVDVPQPVVQPEAEQPVETVQEPETEPPAAPVHDPEMKRIAESVPQTEAENPAGITPVRKPIPRKVVLLGTAALAVIVLVICLLNIPKSASVRSSEFTDDKGRVYTVADYQKVTPNEAGKAYLAITTILENQPTIDGGQFFYTFQMNEINGIGFTIERMEHIIFSYSSNTVTVDTIPAKTIRDWGDDPELKPYGSYQLACGINAKTAAGKPNAIGGAFQVWGTDANGEEITFTAYIPLPIN